MKPGAVRTFFDEKAYLRLYPDVAEAIEKGIFDRGETHWWRHGRSEGREYPSVPSPSGRAKAETRVTVLIDAHPGCAIDLLEQCLLSVLEQSESSLEVFLVERGLDPLDALRLWLLAQKDRRVIVLPAQTHGDGRDLAKARAAARGEYLAILDGSVVLLGMAVSALVAALEESGGASFVYSHWRQSGGEEADTSSMLSPLWLARRRAEGIESIRSASAWWDLVGKARASGAARELALSLGVSHAEPRPIPAQSEAAPPVSGFQFARNGGKLPVPVIEPVRVVDCRLTADEWKMEPALGRMVPQLSFVTPDGETVTARMRLHLSEPLEGLVFLDPREFADGGFEINSIDSPILNRRTSYTPARGTSRLFKVAAPAGVRAFRISEADVRSSLERLYNFEAESALSGVLEEGVDEVAIVMRHVDAVGGGTAVLFQYVSWLADLGISCTIYADSGLPKTRLPARVIYFSKEEDLAAAVREKVVLVFSLFLIEPLLRHRRHPMRIYQLRQAYEPYHYGVDYETLCVDRPSLRLLEGTMTGSIAVSPHLLEYYGRVHGQSCEYIPNGIDTFFYRPRRSARAIPHDTLRILSTGHPHYWVKGNHHVAEAIGLLAAARPGLTIFWTVASGSAEGKLDLSCFRNHPNVHVEHLPNLGRTEMLREFQRADVAVIGSVYEGYGLPAIEAMACGVPVLTSESRGLDYLLEPAENCLTFVPDDVRAIVAALESVIDSPELAERLRRGGLETAAACSQLVQLEYFVPAFERILCRKLDPGRIERLRAKLSRSPLPGVSLAGEEAPTVSVVIPAYNYARFLPQALDSVLSQTYGDWEVIVVDDGSADDTFAVAERYARRDARIRAVRQENGGVSRALNRGIREARGRYFCWLSADDIFHREKLAEQVEAFERLTPDFGLIYSSFDLYIEDEKRIDRLPLHEPIELGAELPEFFRFDYLHGSTTMIRMDVLEEVGLFSPEYPYAHDTEMWMRIAASGYRFHYVPRKHLLNRVHGAQASTHHMIDCRHDAAFAAAHYLSRFSLREIYRYFNLSDPAERARFARHLASRMDHSDALTNHPLLQSRFWSWCAEGLASLEPAQQKETLSLLGQELAARSKLTPRIRFFQRECEREIEWPRRRRSAELDLTATARSILRVDWEREEFFDRYLWWGMKLLADPRTPSIGSELYDAHGTYLKCRRESTVGLSIVAYLARRFRSVREHLGNLALPKEPPESEIEAAELFVRLLAPSAGESLVELFRRERDGAAVEEDCVRKGLGSLPDGELRWVLRASKEVSALKMLRRWGKIAEGLLAARAPEDNAPALVSPRVA